MIVAVTADIVGSRALPDRAAAQRALEDAIARVDADLPGAIRTLTPTVGDELQGIYPTLEAALAALLLLRLALPDGIDCRFGVGIGEVGTVPSRSGGIAEGPGWWAARDAIDALHAAQVRTMPAVRTWIAASSDDPRNDDPRAADPRAADPRNADPRAADPRDDDPRDAVRLANAYVWARDELVSAMTERTRRLVYGRCLGRTQRALAEEEGITQSAVSQLLTSAGGAAVVAGFHALVGTR